MCFMYSVKTSVGSSKAKHKVRVKLHGFCRKRTKGKKRKKMGTSVGGERPRKTPRALMSSVRTWKKVSSEDPRKVGKTNSVREKC